MRNSQALLMHRRRRCLGSVAGAHAMSLLSRQAHRGVSARGPVMSPFPTDPGLRTISFGRSADGRHEEGHISFRARFLSFPAGVSPTSSPIVFDAASSLRSVVGNFTRGASSRDTTSPHSIDQPLWLGQQLPYCTGPCGVVSSRFESLAGSGRKIHLLATA